MQWRLLPLLPPSDIDKSCLWWLIGSACVKWHGNTWHRNPGCVFVFFLFFFFLFYSFLFDFDFFYTAILTLIGSLNWLLFAWFSWRKTQSQNVEGYIFVYFLKKKIEICWLNLYKYISVCVYVCQCYYMVWIKSRQSLFQLLLLLVSGSA